MTTPSVVSRAPGASSWPSLPYEDWKDTCATLRLWTQIVGKIRLVQTPWINHCWHVTFYVTSRGLTTSAMPYGDRTFEIAFDFLDHRLYIDASDGQSATVALSPRSVADFYEELFAKLEILDLPVKIHTTPNEMVEAIPFEEDHVHKSYDPEYANRFFRALTQANRVLQQFRAGFLGKASPVHFFWGSFDLAVTRFSGRTAPRHPGGVPHFPDWVARECYSHEVSSCGFWPGDEVTPYPAFYSYAYPEPPGFGAAPVRPEAASYSTALHEFLLPYEAVRTAESPDATLLQFLSSTYEAAANLGGWDRMSLERWDAKPSELRH